MPPEASSKGSAVSLDEDIRAAMRQVMLASEEEAKQMYFAKVQELLDRKAAFLRAPIWEKVRLIKETA
jgi:hypothetical protein